MFHFAPFCSSDSTSSFKFVSLLAKRPCLSDSFLRGNICKMVDDLETWWPVFTTSVNYSWRRNKPNKTHNLYKRMRLLFWAGASLKCPFELCTLARVWPLRKGDQSAALRDPYTFHLFQVTFGNHGKMSMTLMATGTHTSDQLTVGMLQLPTQE